MTCCVEIELRQHLLSLLSSLNFRIMDGNAMNAYQGAFDATSFIDNEWLRAL
jgi:hypothetical protein